MNWNAKPENVTLPPQYPKKQSCFLEQALINTLNTTSQSSLNYPGSNQEACILGISNPISQPLLNIRNYTTPQQIPFPDMHNGTLVASQTSVERITYANVNGSKQLNHNLQTSSGVTQNVWLNSPMRNPMISHAGATMSHQTGFGTNTPSIHALQNQFVTSDSYSVQLQMIPSNSARVPVTYQGAPGLNPSLSERQVDWTPQYTSSGLTYPDYRPLSKQYSYSSRSFLPDPAPQKQTSVPSTSLHIKNVNPPVSPQTLQSKQTAAIQSYQYAVTQTDKRPPPPPYDCRYAGQPLQSTQHVIKQASVDIPQSQELHLPEMRKDYSRSFQQHWQNLNENVSTVGNSCNLKVNTNVTQPFSEPVRSSVDGAQALAQNNQERRRDCDVTSNQVLDTSATKEKLVRDIKTLVEIKKKFSELARKIKINKNLLMAAGCIKTTDTSYNEVAPNSELSLKQTAQIQSGPQVTLGTKEDKPRTITESTKETNRTHNRMNSNIQDPNWGNCNQVNSVLLNSVCSEKLPMPDKLHDLKVRTSSKTSTVEITQATLSNTQISSGNVNVELNVPTNSETTSVPQSTSFEEYVSKYPNKNTLILSLLTCRDQPQERLLKNASETIQGSKPHGFEINPNTQITGNQLSSKTMETPSTCNLNARVLDNSFFLEHKSSSGMPSDSDKRFSMELLATCLSLWKKPSESTEEKQYNESKNRTAVGVSKPVETCDKSPFSIIGNSHNKKVNTSQETTLSTVVQNYESSSAAVTKGTELQVAVVSPLILSDVKTLSAKGITPEAVPETLYPVIKEGSVCSLQNQLAENTSVTAALKANLNEPVAGTSTDTKMFSPIQKEEQSESTNSDDTPKSNQEKPIKLEPDTHCSVSEQQASYKSRNTDTVSGDMLHIDNICSLVEGDTSYNSQIAKIFNMPPLKRVEPQKSLPTQVITKEQQKEQIDSLTENKDFRFQNDNFSQCTDVSCKITDQAESLQPPESSSEYVKVDSGILEESNMDHITKKESTANDMCSLSAIQQDSCPQEVDMSGSYTAQDPPGSEILSDKASVLYLHDQLSELLKEFPYGIEAVNTHEGSVTQQITNQILKDQTCDKTGCDSKDSADQIQITILNSEQMRELFPEHDDQLCEVDKLMEYQKEQPIKKGSSQCDPQADTDGKTEDTSVDSEKDDVGCCALGWLSMVYEGVPQCQCSSMNNSISKEEGENQCSPSKINSCEQEERTSDRNVPVGCNSSLNNSPKIPSTSPDTKKHFSEIEQGKNRNDMPKTKHKSVRTEQEVSGQFLSKGDKKLDSMQSHKRKRKLQFHEVTFNTSNKMTKFSQESLQQKLMAQNLRPLKPKAGFLTSKNKDLRMKSGSLVQSLSPEKIKLKVGGLRQKVLEKRKLDDGSKLDSKMKKKYEREQNKSMGDSTLKLLNFLSVTNERPRVKEKAVSHVKSSVSKDSSSKISRVLTSKEYLQRQKHKEAMGSNASKKSYVRIVPCDSQYMKSSKLPMQVGNCGKSNERPNSSVQTSKESLNTHSSHGKSLKIHHSEESKTYVSRSVKGIVGGKQPDKMWIDKTRLDKTSGNINSEVEFSQMSPQSKDQRKLYLNRVAFKCTERESICLTKLESSPRKLHKEKRLENKPQSLLPVKDATEKRSMLEFKLCPDGLMKNTNSVHDWKDLQPCPRKEQAPVQVSGIKSTKEDWLRGVTEEKRMPEASQEIDNVLANSRLSKRSFSADGFETLQNPVKDSKAMFQTYKKMYMEKRSRSLGSSPLK
ncbi:retroelement silencing factor 1 [Neovison vison]|uniref:retroelement silencing factor 1 n=1 Tax=Neovison vison TaxID=452646 RepID=UPI001CEFFB97|nr:retroelement silencing factor 1 [Neogale vison]XP_044083703.1 retroelement silencing factor 1 [Neogale vison]XP_044083704.1 retroelement silencing factor 1 [Neogale vison]XP_044083705.1 retroelement silencing factor 1 [Neogale vison]XP_044083706.1 retroelement silencing factor 1 [Neogale vison]XP_044083707.1 retroelement silencing factor 1 [Neogale vison]XP_044083708.1 retroelement silencing factor 1 [Neogale vison]XP_044083709.1 retroelement silencing factor 1 [Neogale vison]XP_04408371